MIEVEIGQLIRSGLVPFPRSPWARHGQGERCVSGQYAGEAVEWTCFTRSTWCPALWVIRLGPRVLARFGP